MKKHVLVGVVLALSFAQVALGDAKEFYYQRFLARQRRTPGTESVRSGEFQARVNPQDSSDTRTFRQRYYFDDTYASGSGAPVLFYLCGEATCQPTSLRGAIEEHARALGAYLISLEHRYYGYSQPFATLSAENLKYLSTDNALLDAVAFQKWATAQFHLTGKWLVIGGSYPGSLSAYYRLQYPDLVAGSLASSAPVRAEANFEGYDRHVFETVGPACADAMRRAVAKVESVLGDATALRAIKQQFEAEALTDEVDFLYLVADMGAMAAQYGYKDRFCQLLTAGDPVDGYARFTREIFSLWGMNALSGSAAGATSLDPNDYVGVFGMRQWFYQSCTEYGYWQNAYHDAAYSVRSPRINAAYHDGICRRLFGITTPVDTSHINTTFYDKLLAAPASRIFFSNGSQDPWSTLSISKVNGNAVNPALSLRLIPDAAHCDDLRPTRAGDSAELKAARGEFLDLAKAWLQ